MDKRNRNKNLKAIAWAQISLMIVEIFAFSFIMGGMIIFSSGNVSAAEIDYRQYTSEVSYGAGSWANAILNPLSWTGRTLTSAQKKQAIVNFNRQVSFSNLDNGDKARLYIDPAKPANYADLDKAKTKFQAYQDATDYQDEYSLTLLRNPNSPQAREDILKDLSNDRASGVQSTGSGGTKTQALQQAGLLTSSQVNDLAGNQVLPYASLSGNYDYSGGILGNIATTIGGTVKVVAKAGYNVVAGTVNVAQAAVTLNPGKLVQNTNKDLVSLVDAQLASQEAASNTNLLAAPQGKWLSSSVGEVQLGTKIVGTGSDAKSVIAVYKPGVLGLGKVEADPSETRRVLEAFKTSGTEIKLAHGGTPITPVQKQENVVKNLETQKTLQNQVKNNPQVTQLDEQIKAANQQLQTIKDARANEIVEEISSDSNAIYGISQPLDSRIEDRLESAQQTLKAERDKLTALENSPSATAEQKQAQQAIVSSATKELQDTQTAQQIIEKKQAENTIATNTPRIGTLDRELTTLSTQQTKYAQLETLYAKKDADLSALDKAKKTALEKELGVGSAEDLLKKQEEIKSQIQQKTEERNNLNKESESAQKTLTNMNNPNGTPSVPIVTAAKLFGNEKLANIDAKALDSLVGASPEMLKEYGLSKIEKNADGTYTLTNSADNLRANLKYNDKGELIMVDGTKKTADTYKTPFGEFTTYHPLLGEALEGLSWGATVLGLTQLFAGFMPEKNQQMVKSAGVAIFAGLTAGKTVYGLLGEFGKGKWGKGGVYAKWTGGVVGALLAYYIFASQYEKEETREQTIEFKCMAWQAPRGGSNCDLCNRDSLKPCSEYRCKSLGQTCKLINAGTGQERCIDSAPDDVTSPGIKPLESVLTNGYAYTDVKIRPPGGNSPAGMKITYNGGCLPAFTPFKFGIVTTDNGKNGVELQPAQCKIEFNHTKSFDEMNYYMDENNLYVENHTQAISLPGATLNKKENNTLSVKADNEYTLYIRCMDGNGNQNRDEFAVRFCIDPTPDLTAPIIKSTSIDSGSAVLYKIDNVSLQVYTNEPSNCKWSRKDASYDNMENNMSCSNKLWQMNAEMLYTCDATLTGIKDKEKNDFFFRCQDMNNNTQQQSYDYTLYGTQPLNILSVGPSGVVGSSTSTANITLTVKTDNGFNNGEANCYYSPTNSNNSFIKMFETGGNTHSQSLDLVGGSYTYYYRCFDPGGNPAYNQTSFEVFVDKYAPAIIRAFQVTSKLYLVTDEKSTCKYSTSSCNFNLDSEGIDMPYANTKEHYSELKNDQTYYIKCSDEFGNQPEPTECSMIIRPYQLTQQ